MVECNLRLLVSITERHRNRGLPSWTLSGRERWAWPTRLRGSTNAKGFRFSTYATWWARRAIARAPADKARTIRILVHVAASNTRSAKQNTGWSRELGWESIAGEIAEATGGRSRGGPANHARGA
jgi:RNA polymerase primary sigma factor